MSLFRPNVDRLAAYTPGEQPQEPGWIKLNTNENPYPPSPRVIEALHAAVGGRLNVYPDPLGTRFRRAAAEYFGVDPDWILPANGSDENLTLILRSFVDPGDTVAYPYPSYILYETLAEIQAGVWKRMLLNADWSWDLPAARETTQAARLVLIPNPNSPSGNRWALDELTQLVPEKGVLILDEAYGDFADEPHRGEILHTPRGKQIVVTRSFSKSYSLAGVRMGFALAHPDIIRGMRKVKDSYNCDQLALAAATAALEDGEWMRSNAQRIRETRTRLTAALTKLGYAVVPSQANFVWATHPTGRHAETYAALKDHKILVRLMRFPGVPYAPDQTVTGLRISIGTDAEIDTLLAALGPITRQLAQ